MEISSTSEEAETEPFFRLLTEGALQKAVSPPDEVQTHSEGKVQSRDKHLEEGQVLSKSRMKDFRPETMACTPMEEVDPAYKDSKTFVVFGKKGTIHRFSARDSLFLMSPLSPIRKVNISLVTNWGFSAFMVSVVIVNTILLASDMDYGFDYFCTAIYIFEFVLKAFSRGVFVDSFTCLRDPWSWLDLVVIITSLIRPFGIHTALQWVRVLKIIPLVAEMRKAASFMFQSVLRLGSAILLAIFWILFFGMIGLQLYLGVLSQKCIKNMPLSDPSLQYDLHKLWLGNANNKSNWLAGAGSDYQICGNVSGSSQCPQGYTCLQGFGSNPYYGYMSFDDYSWALLSVAQISDQDFLEAVLNSITEAAGPWNIIYFTLIFLFSTFGICTLVYAILAEHLFQQMRERKYSYSDVPDIQAEDVQPDPESSETHISIFRKILKSIVNHFAFEVFITLTIILDIVSRSVEDPYWVQEYGSFRIGSVISYLVLIVYGTEFLLKVCALGPKCYFKNGWNIFDFLILLHLFVGSFLLESYSNPLQIFKIVPRWSTLKLTFLIIFKSVKHLWGYFGLFFTFWSFFALLGKNWFDEAYKGYKKFPMGQMPRWNYVDYPHAFIQVFRSWGGENIETAWDCLFVKGWECLVYFPIVVLTTALTLMILTVGVVYITVQVLEGKELQAEEPSTLRLLFTACCARCNLVKCKNKGQQVGDTRVEEIPMKDNDDLLTDLKDTNEVKPSTELPVSPVKEYRRKMQDCTESRVLKGISIFIILATTLVLVFDCVDYQHDTNVQTAIFSMDIIFTAFFGLVSLYKLISFGFKVCCCSPGWIFDIILVVEMILHLTMKFHKNYNGMGYTYFLFFFVRSLRPFMLTSRIDRLEVVIRGILAEIGFLWKFILAGCFIWLYFVLSGVGFFSLQFFMCVDPGNGLVVSERLIEDKIQCLINNFTWENSIHHFDNVAQGFISMSLVGVRLGWIEILQNAFDSVGYDMNFRKENSLEYFNYFFIFYVFGVFFLFSILFGILYHQLQKEKFSGIFFTNRQIKAQKGIKTTPPHIPKPETAIRGKIYDLISSQKFDAVIMTIILLDNMTFSSEFYNMPLVLMDALSHIRLVVLFVYVVEMVLKLVGWGKYYYRSWWNRYDFWVVISSILELIVLEFAVSFFNLQVFRPFRIFRLFQFEPLMSRAKTMKRYFKALSITKPALLNILMFQCLLMFSYSIFGMSVFGNVRERPDMDTINFRTFGSSFEVIFTMASFSGFDNVLKVLINEIDCFLPDPEIPILEICGHALAGVFFVFSFVVVSYFVVLNLYFVFALEIFNQIKELKIFEETLQNVGSIETVRNETPLQGVEVQSSLSEMKDT